MWPRRVLATITVVALSALGATLPAVTAAAAGCSTGSSNDCAPKTGDSGPASMVGKAAPSTVGPNLTGSGTVDLAATSGKPTAVVFWLNTCPHCQAALPLVKRLAEQLGSDGRVVTGAIDIGMQGPEGFETPAAAVETLGLKMPTALITRDLADRWKVDSTPAAFVLDPSGKIRRAIVTDDGKQLVKSMRSALRQAR